jgi:ubiquinone/menaquinone biosynthesis C-methylase UbiE
MTTDSANDHVPDSVASAQAFYTRWARAYDLLARHAPGADSLRQRAVEALDLGSGDLVLDLGCGTGANLRYLRAAVGSEGVVVGVDFASGPVAIARNRAAEWANVYVVRGDATRPPVPTGHGSPDAVLASFLVGMLPAPDDVVRSWVGHVCHRGRLALLDLARTSETPWKALNPLFGVLTRASAPGSDAMRRGDAVAVLDRRVEAAHEALAARCQNPTRSTHVGGFAQISAGRVTRDS